MTQILDDIPLTHVPFRRLSFLHKSFLNSSYGSIQRVVSIHLIGNEAVTISLEHNTTNNTTRIYLYEGGKTIRKPNSDLLCYKEIKGGDNNENSKKETTNEIGFLGVI